MTITIAKTMYVVTMAAETVTAAKIINQISNNPSDTEVPEGVRLLSGVVYLLCGCIKFSLIFSLIGMVIGGFMWLNVVSKCSGFYSIWW